MGVGKSSKFHRINDAKNYCVGKANKFKDYTTEKVKSVFNETFEVDKSTEEMVSDIRKTLPVPVSSVDEIFEACKKEALQRAISAFCLAPIMKGLDNNLEQKFDNLSLDYSEFKEEHNLHGHDNFKNMSRKRDDSKEQMFGLDDGYNSANILDPFNADIEHVVPKNEIYKMWLLRIGKNNSEMIDVMNSSANLVFADKSLNRSKKDTDLIKYMDDNGVKDPNNPNLLHFDINGSDVVINRNDAIEQYKAAKKQIAKMKVDAAKEIGVAMASSGARLAVQQVVGLIIVETIDIFVDEIKDMSIKGNMFNSNGFLPNLQTRVAGIQQKLRARFEERNIIKRAKELGIESGIAGALSIIPQIFLSIVFRMPAFILSMIRECTLSAVRCVRILLSPSVDKYSSIKVVMAGTVTAVMGVYIARVISTVISGVPLLNSFNRQATDVLTGVFVTSIPLSAIYFFDKNKNILKFALKK